MDNFSQNNECDQLDFNDLLKKVCRNFDDEYLAALFFKKYEECDDHSEACQLIYYKMKYFYDNERWRHLLKLGHLYLKQNKKIIANICFVESLRLNQSQEDVYDLVLNLKKGMCPRFPDALLENTCAISVIMTTYERGEEIRASITSCLAQTFDDFELLIVNDGGLEEVRDIVESFHSEKIRYFHLKNNNGKAAALNETILKARGKYIAYLDDDDIYYPEHLEGLFNAIESSPYPFVYSSINGVKGEVRDDVFIPLRCCFVWAEDFSRKKMVERSFLSTVGQLHEKRLFEEVGLYLEGLYPSEDQEFWFRCAKKYLFHHVNKVTAEYRIKDNNITVVNRLAGHFYGDLVRKYYAFFQGDVASLKYFLLKGRHGEAEGIYENIKNQYACCFQSDALKEDLIHIARKYKDHAFAASLIKQYFFSDAKKCLQYIFENKFIILFIRIVPYLPGRFFRCIKLRSICAFNKILGQRKIK